MLYGHTHRQLVRRFGRALVINPGSAGDGRDPRNGGQLSCAMLDTVTEEVAVHHFPRRPPVDNPNADRVEMAGPRRGAVAITSAAIA